MPAETEGTTPAPHSQTLSRGIRVLEILADAREPLSIDELGQRLGLQVVRDAGRQRGERARHDLLPRRPRRR